MLSRTLRRTLLSSQCHLPPTFLLPWTAGLTTASHPTTTAHGPPPPRPAALPQSGGSSSKISRSNKSGSSNSSNVEAVSPTSTPAKPSAASPPAPSSPLQLSPSIRALLPLLRAQGPHYISVHIHGKPYLLTEGDTLRLPFAMPGVEPGDVLRLNRAQHLGSREYTLKAGAAAAPVRSATTARGQRAGAAGGDNVLAGAAEIVPTLAENNSPSAQTPTAAITNTNTPEAAAAPPPSAVAPHFIPHIAKGRHAYLDERLFACRAVVVGTESEPLRVKEKTKRRQRHVKRVRSKLRYTVLKIREVRVRSLEELEAEAAGGGQ